MLTIIQAESEEHLATVRELMLEYAAWLEFELCFQGFEEELRTLPGKYDLPQGGFCLRCGTVRRPESALCVRLPKRACAK